MKILLTGGGSGGHFYPVIAVAEALNQLSKKEHLIESQLFYMAPEPYNEGLLFDNKIKFKKSPAGKWRRYFSFLNFLDIFKTGWGILKAIWIVFYIYPDVIFGKGGYASFPALFAGKILGIPVIIHESDAIPGKANLWASKFAKRIAVSYSEAADHFPKTYQNKIAHTGNPIRKEILSPLEEGAREFLKLEKSLPVIFIIGGSLGAQLINNLIIDSLPHLVSKYEIIHQTGKNNFNDVKKRAAAMLFQNQFKTRYHPFDYLNTDALAMAAGASDLVISRAGSTIFEIASWAKPSILIPIPDSGGDHQRKNSFSYARSGAAVVIEEDNLKRSNILVSEIERIMGDKETRQNMSKAAEKFARKNAAEVIAQEIINLALEHAK